MKKDGAESSILSFPPPPPFSLQPLNFLCVAVITLTGAVEQLSKYRFRQVNGSDRFVAKVIRQVQPCMHEYFQVISECRGGAPDKRTDFPKERKWVLD